MYEQITNEYGSTYWDYVQVPGTGILTTEELLAYEIPEYDVRFLAQWAGDDDDYYSQVFINGYNTQFTYISYNWVDGEKVPQEKVTGGWGNYLKESSDGIGIQCQDYFSLETEPSREGATFEGWLAFKVTVSKDNGNVSGHVLVSDTVYTTEQMLAKAVPEYDVMYVAKWSDIEVEDYYSFNDRIIISYCDGGDLSYSWTNDDGQVENGYSGLNTFGIGCRDTVGSSLSKNGYGLYKVTKPNSTFEGWKVYTCQSLRWVEVVAGSSIDIGNASILYQDQQTYMDGITYDRYVVADSYEVSSTLLTMEQLMALSAEKSYYVQASWSANPVLDTEVPVFEGISASYDADTNTVVFEVNVYDTDSESWGYEIIFCNETGSTFWADYASIYVNPSRVEYAADKLPNGRYTLDYVNLYDQAGNYTYVSLEEDNISFEVTNSPYVCPVVIADIIPSKDVAEVSKYKTEEVTINVKLERGTDRLVRDIYNKGRVGYMAYEHSDFFDLYMDEQGNITGVYPVDWLVPSDMESAVMVWLNVAEDQEDGSTNTTRMNFEFDSSDEIGAFEVKNSTEWQGEMNEGPVRVLDYSIVNKATGEEICDNATFDVADGQSYTLVCNFTVDTVIPDGVWFSLVAENVLDKNDWLWIDLEYQTDGTYQCEITIDDTLQYTQYVVTGLGLTRGQYGYTYRLNDDAKKSFLVKNGDEFAINEREVTIRLFTQGKYEYEEMCTTQVIIEGTNTASLEELFGGTAKYGEMIAQTERTDGVTADGWVTGLSKYDSLYRADDVIYVDSDRTEIELYASYPYTDIVPIWGYFDAEGYYEALVMDAVRVERGTTVKEFFDMFAESDIIPSVPDQGEHEFVGWSAELDDGVENTLLVPHEDYNFYINVRYDVEHYVVQLEVLYEDGEYGRTSKIQFPYDGMTVGDLLKELPAPRAVDGYTFLNWEISEGNQCYLGHEYIDGEWVAQYADWEEDMLLVEYGYPELHAVYEVNEVDESVAQVRAFLERMYTVALGRATDPSGVDYWTNQLLSHADDGATVSCGFILGEEFVGNNYSNEEFVTILYSTFFDRTADEGGKTYWSSILEGGATRASVLAGFVNSNEFFELCNGFGISRGVLRGDGSAINPGIYQFSERLYSEILERQGDMGGIEYWTIQLDERAITPEQAAAGFFFGGEYLAKNTTNEQYVQALYRTFMGREADADGLGYWKGMLESGTDRMTVLWSLAGCAEFQSIKQQYGL